MSTHVHTHSRVHIHVHGLSLLCPLRGLGAAEPPRPRGPRGAERILPPLSAGGATAGERATSRSGTEGRGNVPGTSRDSSKQNRVQNNRLVF